jgi:glucose/arabinose dehydrogenase
MRYLAGIVVAILVCIGGVAPALADYKTRVVAEGLEFPWSLAFLPNGEMLVTERVGRLRMIRDEKLVDYDVRGVPEVFAHGQGGLFDVLVDPGFHDNERIYLSFSAGSKSRNALHVVSARLDGSTLYDIKNILTVTPDKNTPHHFGGRMAMLPDGTLLVTSGDGFDFREQAQSLDSLLGKVLRINTDGSIPQDNPFVGKDNARGEILTYGNRNPQAIIVTRAGKIWMHEHGPKGGDELNLILPGRNYGWPAITYGMDYSGAYVSPFTVAAGMEQPVVQWTPSIAPAGMTEYQGDVFPAWRGNLFVAALAEKTVRRLSLEGNKVLAQEKIFTELDTRFRDVRTGPGGFIYLLTDSDPGTVYKVIPD